MTVRGKAAFYLCLLVIAIVVMAVWITGLNIHRTILDNAQIAVTILSIIFFAFMTLGLYKGVKLLDDFGNIKSKLTLVEPSGSFGDPDIGDFAPDGAEGIIAAILLWIAISILAIVFVFFFETILFSGLVIVTAMLYWVFFRATRLILRYARFTRNKLPLSLWIGFKYSLFYSGWIYGILWAVELFRD